MTAWLDAGPDNLSDGVPVVRKVGNRLVMILRQHDALRATDAVCPHKFALLSDGEFGDACVTCPQHDATFDLTSGHPGPDEGWAGRLPVHSVRCGDQGLEVLLTPS